MKKSAEKRERIKTKVPKNNIEEKTETENLPGYPYYPSSEDIMNVSEKKFEVDIENTETPLIRDENPESVLPDESDVDFKSGTAADVSEKDLTNLGDENLEMDMGDDEDLKHRSFPVDMEGKDLVVPGAELDDEQENIGSEDEENNFYSHADN